MGYRGFFYHFLHADTGRRAWKSELSTIDTTLLLAGMLVAAEYFAGSSADEREVRERTASIYARVDWRWAQHDEESIVLGWKPESGFIRYRWTGYSEAMLLYVLALAAPQHAVGANAYSAWTSGFRWRRLYGREVLYAGPLFIHQFSHIWLDLRDIRDEYMAARNSDYFANSRAATADPARVRDPQSRAAFATTLQTVGVLLPAMGRATRSCALAAARGASSDIARVAPRSGRMMVRSRRGRRSPRSPSRPIS